VSVSEVDIESVADSTSSTDWLRITEIFHSIQGEADAVGWPTVFVRLTGCPLRCTWCDTTYSFTGGERRSISAVLQEVASFGTRYVCVTGGEPLAQKRCLDLLRQLCDAGYHVSLETSGAIDISGVDSRVRKVMDLKAPGSAEEAKNRWANLAFILPHDQIKFVLNDKQDYDWAVSRMHEHSLSEKCQILFSPVANQLSPTTLAEWILRDKLNVRLQVQLHKILWGGQAGR
jgi:7-carboxy-7-deazaguanine synthase